MSHPPADVARDVSGVVVRSAPPLAVWALHQIMALSLSNWLALASIGYIALQAAYLAWRWRRELQRGALPGGAGS